MDRCGEGDSRQTGALRGPPKGFGQEASWLQACFCIYDVSLHSEGWILHVGSERGVRGPCWAPPLPPPQLAGALWSQSKIESPGFLLGTRINWSARVAGSCRSIFTTPTGPFYWKVQLQAECQGLAGQLSPRRRPQAEAGTTAWSVCKSKTHLHVDAYLAWVLGGFL